MGVVTVSTSRVVIEIFCDHNRSRWRSTPAAVDADVGDRAAGGNDILAKLEGGGNADGLDRRLDAVALGQFFYLVDDSAMTRC